MNHARVTADGGSPATSGVESGEHLLAVDDGGGGLVIVLSEKPVLSRNAGAGKILITR